MPLKMVLSGFLNHLEKTEMRRKLSEDIYDVEFQKLKMLTESLKTNPDYSCNHGALEINRCKNRYKDILPYDYTRVILTEDSDKPGSDYTNANYIKGATGSAAYIACQGPLPHTVVDFWRMIWECEVKVVIMACNEKEAGKQKCENYWPEDEPKDFGNFHVELLKTQNVCSDFLIRKLKAKYEDEERTIYQFHYMTWPDHGVPPSVQPILHLIQMVRKFQSSDSVPILVHCSAGCGRTGTICAIDYVWRLMLSGRLKEPFSLYGVISKMRQQRIAMVQTKEQYVLVHHAVAALFEQQLELIASHFYENIDLDGNPVTQALTKKEENIYEEVNCENIYSNINDSQVAESVTEYQQRAVSNAEEVFQPSNEESPDCVQECHEMTTEDRLNEHLPRSDESHTIPHSESVIPLASRNSTNIMLHSNSCQQENLSEFTADTDSSFCEQNANFTLSLPLSTAKGKQKISDLADVDCNTSLTVDSVSCNVKIDREGKVKVLQEKDDVCLQPSSISRFCSSATTNAKQETSCNLENCHDSVVADSNCLDDNAVPCKIDESSKPLPLECSKEECKRSDTAFFQIKDITIKEKHADIEEIFQEILSDTQSEKTIHSATSGKQLDLVKQSSSLMDKSKIDERTSCSEIARTKSSDTECENGGRFKVAPIKHKENRINNNISEERSNDGVLPNLMSGCTQASKKRYLSLVNECEQSFSEIERLLEEKDKMARLENTHKMENADWSKNLNGMYSENADSSTKKILVLEDSYCLSVDKNKNFTMNKSLQDSFEDNSSISKQPEGKILNKDSCNDLIETNSLVHKNVTTFANTKLKCFGIEEALKLKQINEGSLEYIDGVGIHDEQKETKTERKKQSFSGNEINSLNSKSVNELGEESAIVLSKVSDAVPPDIKMFKCNVRTEVSRKEGTAYKRTGKIFDKDDIFSQYNEEELRNLNSSSEHKANDMLCLSFDKGKSQNTGDQVNSIWNCEMDKNTPESNLLVASTHTVSHASNIEVSKSENLVNDKSESSEGKVTVIRRPSITKLKALFEKTTTTSSDSNKQNHIKHPLLRSQSYRMYRNKPLDKDNDKDRYSVRPTLLDKVTKMLHLPSVESSCESNKVIVRWKSSDVNEVSHLAESKEIPRPLADTEGNKKKPEVYYVIKGNSNPEEITDYAAHNKIACNAVEESQRNENVSEESSVGCLDFSSLISIVSKENTNNTYWYEQGSKTQCLDNEQVSQFDLPEQTKECCNTKSSVSFRTKVETDSTSVVDKRESHCNQEGVGNFGGALPPKLPFKKKYQNVSFHSYLEDKEDGDKIYNFCENSSTGKTKWYFETDENNSTGFKPQMLPTDDYRNSSSNLDGSIVSEKDSNSPHQPTINSAQESKSPQVLPRVETNLTQPPLPPKKKNNSNEKAGKTDWYCKELTKGHNPIQIEGVEIRTPLYHPYVNVLKTREGILILDMNDDIAGNHSKPDLYTNVNTTSIKNIEQIENSLQQHPRGAIIDLTSRQSYANEQHSDAKPKIYGSHPKLSETVITTDLEESHYNNEKPICDSFSGSISFKLLGNKGESLDSRKKAFGKKHYETLWPEDEVSKQAANTSPVGNRDVRTDAKWNFVEHHNNIFELENSSISRHSPPTKPKLPSFGNFLSKSKSSSALCVKKTREKNSVSNENSKFKDLHVNKVVCELNNILSGLAAKPFRTFHKETNSCLEKAGDAELQKQLNASQPLVPPRRKPKSDHVGGSAQDASFELQGQCVHAVKNFKRLEQNLNDQKGQNVGIVNMKPSVHHLSKSKTMSDINKIKFVDASKRNSSHSKDVSECFSRLPSVYENVDSMHSPTMLVENNVQNIADKKTSGKTSKLKHSSSDASVFALLRRTKSLNRVPDDQGEECISQKIKSNFKSEHKSYIKRQNPPAASKPIVISRKDCTQQMIKVENGSVKDEKQLISHAKRGERRSVDDMDAFPIAPPRTRRHGPTPQKGVAAMKKFVLSLDEDIAHSKSQPITESTVAKIADNFEHL